MDVRFGILGAGRIAHKFAEALRGIGGVPVAVASRDKDRAEAFGERHGIPVSYGSYAELLADPQIDCVYVATPHGLHRDHMIACLEAGKPVLCEKAFTLDLPEAEEVFRLAASRGLFVMEAMWTRFLPVIREALLAVQNGEIGKVVSLEADFAFPGDRDPAGRLLDPALGGGALLDVGIYPITLANLFLGIPESVRAEARFAVTGVDVDETIVYGYPDAEAVLRASFLKLRSRTARIKGTEGSLVLPAFWAAERAEIRDVSGRLRRRIVHPHLVNGMEYEILETARCLKERRKESPLMPWSETREILRQTDGIRGLWNFRYPRENR